MLVSPRIPITRLILWNVDLTLVDVGQVARAASAEAFEKVTGRPLVRLSSIAGRTESEIFFESLALNDVEWNDDLLPAYTEALTEAFTKRAASLREQGRLLPGVQQTLQQLQDHGGVVQTVLTGAIRPNTVAKITAFGLEKYLDLEIGGFGSEPYPKATLLQVARGRAKEKYGVDFDEATTVYVGDSPRDIEAARIGGAVAVALTSGRSTEAELSAAGADVVLDGLAEVPVSVLMETPAKK